MRVALFGCLLFLPALGFAGEGATGPARDESAAAGDASGSGAPPPPPEAPPAATSMPAFRTSTTSREDATFEFELPSANGELEPSMDFTTQLNPTVTSK